MKKQRAIPLYVYVGVLLIIALLGIGPVFLADNPVALVFFNVMVASLTTLVSVQATRHYSENVLQENLTRYGVQAWRTLNALQVKVSQHLGQGVSLTRPSNRGSWMLTVPNGRGGTCCANFSNCKIGFRLKRKKLRSDTRR